MKQPKRGDVLQHPLRDHRGRHPQARVLGVVSMDLVRVRYTDTGTSDIVAWKAGWKRARRRR
jgi:hypothetical protein